MKVHRTDRLSLAFGLIFLGTVAWWLIARTVDDLALPTVGWFVAGGLILFGLLGLIGSLRSARRRRTTDPVSATPVSVDPFAADALRTDPVLANPFLADPVRAEPYGPDADRIRPTTQDTKRLDVDRDH